MAEKTSKKTEEQLVQEERDQTRRTNFRREIIGIFLGLAGAMMAGSLIPAVRENVSLGTLVLWGGAVGGVLASLHRFEPAGAALTRRENRALNIAVGALGFGLPLLLLVWVLLQN